MRYVLSRWAASEYKGTRERKRLRSEILSVGCAGWKRLKKWTGLNEEGYGVHTDTEREIQVGCLCCAIRQSIMRR